MSVESISLVLNHSQAVGTTKLVLVGIANHDGDGGSWPTLETLARYANCSERTVRRHIEELIKLGELKKIINGGGSHFTRPDRRPNLYQITIQPATQTQPTNTESAPGLAAVVPVDNPENGGTADVHPLPERGDKSGSTGGQVVSTREANGRTPVTERADTCCPPNHPLTTLKNNNNQNTEDYEAPVDNFQTLVVDDLKKVQASIEAST